MSNQPTYALEKKITDLQMTIDSLKESIVSLDERASKAESELSEKEHERAQLKTNNELYQVLVNKLEAEVKTLKAIILSIEISAGPSEKKAQRNYIKETNIMDAVSHILILCEIDSSTASRTHRDRTAFMRSIQAIARQLGDFVSGIELYDTRSNELPF